MIRRSYGEELTGLSRGLVPNIVKVAPSIAVSFWTFETVRDMLAKWEEVDQEDML